ncbi:MAG: hypothetical protein GX783_01840 [Clostridiales bacterium]|nr:hypothetical protein [Clostridiales bacterium]
MPTSMTRNVISNLNTYIINKNGIKPVTDGPFFCLGDNLGSNDWNFIRRNWDLGYTHLPKKVFGITLVWSDKKLDKEIENFIHSRVTPTHRLVSELMYAGAPICCVVRIEDLKYASGPILVTNPELLCDEELDMVLSYENGDVLFIGTDEKQLPDGYKDKTIVCEKNGFGGVKLSAKQNATNINEANISGTNINEINANETNTKGININAIEIQNNSVYSFDPKLSHEPVNALWTHPLSFAPISKEFFSKCASYIIEISESPFIEKETTQEATCYNPCKCISVKTENDALRVFVSNDDYYYNHPKINVRRRIRDVKCLTKYHGYKVDFTDTCFTSRIPGRGMEVFEIITEE